MTAVGRHVPAPKAPVTVSVNPPAAVPQDGETPPTTSAAAPSAKESVPESAVRHPPGVAA